MYDHQAISALHERNMITIAQQLQKLGRVKTKSMILHHHRNIQVLSINFDFIVTLLIKANLVNLSELKLCIISIEGVKKLRNGEWAMLK